MYLLVYSDLHIDVEPFEIPKDTLDCADVVILAGDIGFAEKTIQWIKNNIINKPVLWVFGNHEFYGGHWERTPRKVKKLLIGDDYIQVLDNSTAVLNGVRFIGTTLWTDCKIREDEIPTSAVMKEMAFRMRDYKKIRAGNEYRKLRVSDTISAHIKSARWLEETLSQEFDGPTVVITHHGAHKRCLNDQHEPYLDGAYASDMSETIQQHGPNLWVYGHTHKATSFMVGRTKFLSNPRGYVKYGEETGFNSELLIEV